MKKKSTHLLLLVIVALMIVSLFAVFRSSVSVKAAPSITGLHVSGNQILNGNGQVIRLLGVNRSGTEYMCTSGSSIFDGPNDATSVQAITSWATDAVRVSLNEDCWLGINGFPAGGTTASQYQQAIVNYVNLLNSNGLIALIDLHWNAPGSTQAKSQQIMPDLDHAPAFWTSVANTFKNNSSAIFDLYNEPHPSSWSCWLNGSSSASASPCSDVNFAVAGMQTLVNTVRNTGATNIVDLGGLAFANDLSQWLQNKPNDPQHNIVAGFHLYNFNSCNNLNCWNAQVAPVIQQVPLITGELGENDCAHGFIDSAMSFFDQHGASYMGWAWITSSCGGFPSLITAYDGTPTAFGIGLRDHLRSLAGNPTPTPAPTNTPAPTPTPNPKGSVAIDAGGAGAGNFVADTDFSGGTAATHTPTVDTSGVTNAAPQEVYQTERFGNFTYTIPGLTANASYTVRLHFAETFWTTTGQRTFNVSINNTQVLQNFDIVAAAGGANRAVIEQFTENASSSGTFTIQFTTVINNAKVDGIEIIPSGIPTPTPTPKPTPTPNPNGPKYSFEDGGLDGWSSTGHVSSLQNSTAVGGQNGTHALQVVYSSSSTSDFPYISVTPSSGTGPTAGQTLTAWVFVPNGTSQTVIAKLFIQDSSFTWHVQNDVTVSQRGSWVQLSFALSGFSGNANMVGVQFNAAPANTNTTVYVDSVNWQ